MPCWPSPSCSGGNPRDLYLAASRGVRQDDRPVDRARLLLLHRYRWPTGTTRSVRNQEIRRWPGGNMDPGETPWECAVRECREESGIVFEGERRLLGMQFLVKNAAWPTNQIGFIFDGGTLRDEQIKNIVLDPKEHTEVCVRTLDEWEREMTPRNFAQLREIDAGRRAGTVAFMEEGAQQ
ncbi:NUDIX domain-containing protein [Streptomyces sp. NPDC059875]|uniref:NUDIX domain-containing protein n=1 Tax=unclassified Streptomyces TaxID=2593676 RepID=UPI0036578EE5